MNTNTNTDPPKTETRKHKLIVWEVLVDAWELRKGTLWPIWAIVIPMIIAVFIVQTIIGLIFHFNPDHLPILYQYLFMPIILGMVIMPFFAGGLMIALKQAREESINARTGYNYFNKTWQLMVVAFVIEFLANITIYIIRASTADTPAPAPHLAWWYILAGVITLFVYVFSILAALFVVDKGLSPIKALYQSYKTIRRRWFKTLVLLVSIYLFFIIAAIPYIVGSMVHPYAKLFGGIIFLIALIWLIPYTFLVQAFLYHKLVD